MVCVKVEVRVGGEDGITPAAAGARRGEFQGRKRRWGKRPGRWHLISAALASVYLLVLPLQGEWDLQPLPEIFSKLEEPAPRCPAGRGQSPAGPTVVSIGGGKG